MANIDKYQDVNQTIRVAQSNVLTQSRYDFSLIEKRACYFIIKEVRKRFIENRDGQRTVFDNLIVTLPTKEMTKFNLELKQVYKALIELRKKTIFMETDDTVIGVGYINYFRHRRYDAFIEVEVSNTIMPHLVELAEQYTEYDFLIAMTLQTKYTQRFYEYCQQYRNLGFFKITVEELRTKLVLNDKYPRYALLKTKVIDVAQKELNTLFEKGECDVTFTYTGEPESARTPKLLNFKIISKATEVQIAQAPTLMDLRYKIREYLDRWLATKTREKNRLWVDKVMTELDKNPENMVKLYKRFEKITKEKPNENHAALARHIIEKDFLPKEKKEAKKIYPAK